ncbi:MAG TPA: DUF4333 domain-containing protein [Acidimicrobiia bacterium]|jgi:hypothetical protein|nr:DUF4333 domain-containing protein [Acidimicrobiia bacterium]
MRRSRGFALVLVCTVAAVVACSGGPETLDGKDVEKTIGKQLHKDFAGAPIGATKCPKEIKKKSGKQFECTATVGSEPVPYTVTQTERDPGYRAVRQVAVLDVSKIQNFVQTQYDQTVGVQVTAACAPGKTVLAAKPQTTIPCTVTDAVGTTDTVQVQVNDISGNISIGTI